jgi:hypothetical protein
MEQSGRKRARITAMSAAANPAQILANERLRFHPLAKGRDGKEGVDGSSPSEVFLRFAATLRVRRVGPAATARR